MCSFKEHISFLFYICEKISILINIWSGGAILYAEIFFIVIFTIPLYILLFWMYHHPEESLLFGYEQVFQKRPKVTEAAIRHTKFLALFTMIYAPFFILLLFFQHIFLIIMLVGYCVTVIISSMYFLRKWVLRNGSFNMFTLSIFLLSRFSSGKNPPGIGHTGRTF